MSIPDRIPSVYFDRLLLLMEASGVGRFVIQMEMVFSASLDAERLMTALDLMLDAEPVLGCRMVPDPKLPYWQRLSGVERKNFSFTTNENDYLAFRNQGLNCSKGPQLQACLFRRAQGDKLLLKVAHHVSDAGGVKDIAAKLSAVYNRLEKEPGYKTEPNLAGCRDFGQIMRHVPLWAYPVIFVNFMRQNWSNTVPASTLHLQLPQGPTAPLTYIIRHIPAKRMEKIKQFGKARDATINDVIAAAYYRALVKEAGWDNKAMLRLQTTIDLRRWYLPDEKAESICNLSVYEYPNLGRNLGKDFSETVDLVSRSTKSRKNSWFGLTDVCLVPVLKLLSFESQVKLGVKGVAYLIKKKAFPNALTNMGEIKKQSVRFGIEPARAYLLTPFVFPPFFGGGMSMYQGELTLCGGVPVHVEKNIDRFYQTVVENLPGEACITN
jgi:NRPS condensation-like uncharacterized protein